MVPYRTMTEIAATAIRDAILNGIYLPGTRLIPAKLEQEVQLGRVAIREALKELAGWAWSPSCQTVAQW